MTFRSEPSPPGPRAGAGGYWFCQAIGWGGIGLLGLLDEWAWLGWASHLPFTCAQTALAGVAVTHGYRSLVRRAGWTRLPPRPLLGRAVLGWALLTLTMFAVIWLGDQVFGPSPFQRRVPDSVLLAWVLMFVHAMVLSAIWNAIYFAYHAGLGLTRRQHHAETERWGLQVALVRAELEALKAQVHPHFLFNCLNSLRGLVAEDRDRAQAAVTQLAGILRYALQSGRLTLVPFAQEMRFVEDCLALETLRFEERLRVRRNVDPAARDWLVPPMAVQTLVENAVKYGVAPFARPEEIELAAAVDGEVLRVEVSNGGRLLPAAGQLRSTGLGLVNLRERLRRVFGGAAALHLAESGPPGRVRATLLLPRPAEMRRPEPTRTAAPREVLVAR